MEDLKRKRPLPTLVEENNFYNRSKETLVSQEVLKTIRRQQKKINLVISVIYCLHKKCKVLDEVFVFVNRRKLSGV